MHTTSPPSDIRRGAAAAAGSYLLWGILPIYWKTLDHVDSIELMAHRLVWTLVVVLAYVAIVGELQSLRETWRSSTARRTHLANSALLTANWGIFIWAINHEQIIEASLGYFLVPLLNAAVGRLIFHEQLRRAQIVALALATAGVAVMVFWVGALPWVSLGLAATWGCYGLNRKRSSASASNGLAVETLYSLPFALLYLGWLAFDGGGAFGHTSRSTHLLIVGTGVISVVPLTLFAIGAKRLQMTTIGVLQYIAPSCQFLIGWWVYHEPLSPFKAAAFVLIWAALGIYSADAWHYGRRKTDGVTESRAGCR